MRKIDALANEKFNGDTISALNYLLNTDGSIESYIDELNKEEAQIVLNWAVKEAHKQFGGEENFRNEIMNDIELSSLELTSEEVKNAPKNPYKAAILKSFLSMLLMDGGVIALTLASGNIGIDPSALGVLGATVTGLFSAVIANNIIKYFKFKKMKKRLSTESIEDQLVNENVEESSIGRKL